MSGSGSWGDPYDPCHPSSNDSDEEGPQFDFHGIHHERDHHARRQGYGPEQRDSQESLVNGDTHDDSGQASYSYNPRLAMPTFGNDSGDGAQHDLTTYNGQHQYSMLQPIEDPTAYTPTPGYELHGYYTQQSQQQNSPAIEPSVDFHMAVDFDIDFNVGFDPGPLGMEFDAVPVSGDQVEYREEAPWSSENHYNEYSRPPVEQLTSWANLVGASQTSSASHHSSDTENLVSSSADSSGDAEDPDWGESSVATMRPTHPLPSNPSDHTRYASAQLNYHGQGQGFFIPPTGHTVGVQRAYSIPDRTGVHGTSRRESKSSGNHLHVPDTDASSSRPSSPAGSATSDPLPCPHCSATFTGVYRLGNYGRHRRQKHLGQPREWACEANYCDKVFKRPDARLKHYRRRHPELLPRGL